MPIDHCHHTSTTLYNRILSVIFCLGYDDLVLAGWLLYRFCYFTRASYNQSVQISILSSLYYALLYENEKLLYIFSLKIKLNESERYALYTELPRVLHAHLVYCYYYLISFTDELSITLVRWIYVVATNYRSSSYIAILVLREIRKAIWTRCLRLFKATTGKRFRWTLLASLEGVQQKWSFFAYGVLFFYFIYFAKKKSLCSSILIRIREERERESNKWLNLLLIVRETINFCSSHSLIVKSITLQVYEDFNGAERERDNDSWPLFMASWRCVVQ